MATHTMLEGTVKIGANTIAEIHSFSWEDEIGLIDDSENSDAWATMKPGRKSWSGEIECALDETDATGQGALTVGAEVTLDLLFEGATTGDARRQGAVIVERVSKSVPRDGLVMATFAFTGNGAPTDDTVP